MKRAYTRKENEVDNIISNVKDFLLDLKTKCTLACNTFNIKPDQFPIQVDNVLNLTSKLCNVSVSTVTRACRTGKTGPKPKRTAGRKKFEWDSFLTGHVRRVCYHFYERKEYPTIKKLFQKCTEDDTFPNMKKETFRKCLKKKCGFKYRRIFKKPVFLERTDIVAQRNHYLRHIRHYRQEGYKIFYCDQTWTSPDQSRNNCWQILLDQKEIQDFKRFFGSKVLSNVDRWTGGFMVKGGNGRVIVNHAGSEDGFLKEAQDIFISKKDSKDYHGSINSIHFLDWFRKVVQALPDKSVFVLDQAPYHKARVEGTVMPKMHWVKAKIIKFMQDRQIPLPDLVEKFEDMTKAEMVELSKKYPVQERFQVEEIARSSGKDIKVLFLPVAHCELNPIELIWAYVKGKVSETNQTGGIKYIRDLTEKWVEAVTPDLWKSCVKIAISYEEKFWKRDGMIEHQLTEPPSNPNLVFQLESDSDSEADSEEDSSSSESEEDLHSE